MSEATYSSEDTHSYEGPCSAVEGVDYEDREDVAMRTFTHTSEKFGVRLIIRTQLLGMDEADEEELE